MNNKSTETKSPADIDSIYDDSIIFSKPVVKRTVTKPEWSNTQTGTSDNILDNISRPILRRQSPPVYECSPDCINTSNSIIDIINNYNKKDQ